MTKKTAEEIAGYEYDWLACDSAGHIAMLSTAGGGYAPKMFLADTEMYDEAIARLRALPTYSAVKLAPELGVGLANPWRELAERGIFSFDSSALGGPYRLVGAPTSAIQLSQLPEDIARVVARIGLRDVEFGKAAQISAAQIIAWEDPI